MYISFEILYIFFCELYIAFPDQPFVFAGRLNLCQALSEPAIFSKQSGRTIATYSHANRMKAATQWMMATAQFDHWGTLTVQYIFTSSCNTHYRQIIHQIALTTMCKF